MAESGRKTHWQGGAAALLGMMAAGALWLGATLYTHAAESILRAMDVSVGEVLKDRGLRHERAGELAAAAESYRTALRASFNGAEHRAEAQEHLGRILLADGAVVGAAVLLKAAAAHPDRRASASSALAVARARTGDADGALEVLKEAAPSSDAQKLEAGEALVCALAPVAARAESAVWEQAPQSWRWAVAPFVATWLEAKGRACESRALLLRYLASGLGDARPEARNAWEAGTDGAACPLQALLESLRENS